MKKIMILILTTVFILSFGEVSAMADVFYGSEPKGSFLKKRNKIRKYFFNVKKVKNKRLWFYKGLFYKKNKNTPPSKGDDLWILQLIYLVALLSILTFVLSAIMLATGGMSSLWLTLMIVGGVIGVLPFIIVGAALLF